MAKFSTFRGASGEVVRSYCSFNTLLTALPILMIWIAILVPTFFLSLRARSNQGSGDLYVTILFTIVHASMVARFALPATRGDLTRGFFDPEIEHSEVLAFVCRYLAAIAVWWVAIWLVGNAIIGYLPHMFGASAFMTGFDAPASSVSYALFFGLIMLYLGLILVGPLASFLIATCAPDIGQVFSLSLLRWIFLHRLDDLPAFFSNIIGSILLFYIKFSIPLMFLSAMFSSGGPAISNICAILAITLPMLTSPILIGRMCGAFVYGQDDFNLDNLYALANTDSPASTPAEESKSEAVNRVQTGELAELNVDPSPELLSKIRELASKYETLNRVFLCSGNGLIVVVELSAETSLKQRQEIKNDLGQLRDLVPGLQLEFPNEERLLRAQTVGLRVYQRRS